MSKAKISRKENHKRAPQSAAFVEAMRSVFGEVKVLYVDENGLKIGETTEPRNHLSS